MNEAIFAGTCIIHNNQILLVQESHKEAYGLWSLPLGHVEDNESTEQSAIRETKEETGYEVKLINHKSIKIDGKEFKSTKDFNEYSIELSVYRADIVSGELKAGDDILDVKWFNLEDLQNIPLRGTWIIDAIL